MESAPTVEPAAAMEPATPTMEPAPSTMTAATLSER
jgi:hypothetical protein